MITIPLIGELFACFQVKVVDREKSNKVYEDVMKKLDRLENDYLPQVKLDKTEVSQVMEKTKPTQIRQDRCLSNLDIKSSVSQIRQDSC